MSEFVTSRPHMTQAISRCLGHLFEMDGFVYFRQIGITDATDNACIARMVNDIDSASKANCKMKKVVVHGDPRLALYALKDIEKGAELRYDYGDGKAPWRKRKRKDETERPVLYTKPSN